MINWTTPGDVEAVALALMADALGLDRQDWDQLLDDDRNSYRQTARVIVVAVDALVEHRTSLPEDRSVDWA